MFNKTTDRLVDWLSDTKINILQGIIFLCLVTILLVSLNWIAGMEKKILSTLSKRVVSVERSMFVSDYSKVYFYVFGEHISDENLNIDVNKYYIDFTSDKRLMEFEESLSDGRKSLYKNNKLEFYRDLDLYMK